MRHSIRQLTHAEATECIYRHAFNLVDGEDNGVWQRWLAATSNTWVGLVEGEIACMWGIVPPTLLSSRCYLWLFTTEALKGNEFIFIRRSQRWVEGLLNDFSEIIGHVRVGQDQSIRWLRLLGAKFHEDEGPFIPFTIRAKKYG